MSLPRVVIDLEKLRHINCGLGRYSLHLGTEILAAAAGRFRPVFLLPAGASRYLPAGGDYDAFPVAPWNKEAVRRLYRPLVRPFLPAPRIALWHVTSQMSKYLPLDDRVPVVLTIHDLNVLHESPREVGAGEIDRKLADIQRKVNRAAAIVTDSEYVAADVSRPGDLGGRPVHVVPLAVSDPPAAAATRPAFLPDGPFLLSIGNCLPHKNFHVLFPLLARLPEMRLVVAGKKSTPYGEFLEREVATSGLGSRVILPGEVNDADRQWLYEHCEAFLFPSLTEGFGFPVLEAMQCGKPVFVSRATSLPEVAGDVGCYFAGSEPPELERAYREGMTRFETDTTLPERLKKRAAAFTWAATARGYGDVYAGVMEAVSGRETAVSSIGRGC
ncbi:MAG: glycosyltransferase family 4 protein [Planctomycetia bacterium]